MKITGVIPARYGSTRLPGKPLYDFFGKPMVWWVYRAARQVAGLDRLVVAADDRRVMAACEKYGLDAVMTSPERPTHIHRLLEVADLYPSDYYLCVCGDEPLISPASIGRLVPLPGGGGTSAALLTRVMTDQAEVESASNIKTVVNARGECMLFTRARAPRPFRPGLSPVYRKIIGVERYDRAALEFFVSQPAGDWERTEDIAILRFLENGLKVTATNADEWQLSVDTHEDVEIVKRVMKERGLACAP